MEKNKSNLPVLIEIQCFGIVSFWVNLIHSKHVLFEQHEHFQKTGYRNRYQVLGANGVITLSIPVIGGRETRNLTREVRIDNTQNFQKNHWKTLESCYNKSPFFFHYAPVLQPIFQKKYELLWDFNMEVFEWVVQQLKLPLQHAATASYNEHVPSSFVMDCRGIFKTSARNNFFHSPYYQVFNGGFQQNLSILDILFNLGPETSSYLLKQTTI